MQVMCEIYAESYIIDSLIVRNYFNITHFGKDSLSFWGDKETAKAYAKDICHIFNDGDIDIYIKNSDTDIEKYYNEKGVMKKDE